MSPFGKLTRALALTRPVFCPMFKKLGEPKNKYSTRKCMLDNWLPLGLTVGEIEVVTAGKRCVELLNMLYSKNSSIKLVTKYLVQI